MQQSSTHNPSFLSLLLACVAVVVPLMLLGCSATEPEPDPPVTGEVPAEEQPTEKFPAPEYTDLSTPEDSVRTYLAWISHAYRVMDSQVAWDYMTSWEFVRVDAYLQKNMSESRGIDQRLQRFEITQVTGSETTKSVDTYEDWSYWYFGPDGLPISEELTATYTNRYTVVRDAGRNVWLVDEVDAVPKGEVE